MDYSCGYCDCFVTDSCYSDAENFEREWANDAGNLEPTWGVCTDPGCGCHTGWLDHGKPLDA